MSLSIDDLPTFEAARRLGRSRAVDSPLADAYRVPSNPIADVVGSVGITKVLEMAGRVQQQVFPSAVDLGELQAAAALGPSYSQYTDCGPYNYDATCNEACFGFAPHQMDPMFCATCDEQRADPDNNPSYNWHFVGSRGQYRYMDREPDVCAGRDAWKWGVGTCGSCAESAVFRCHDGWKKVPDSSSWDPTICQGLVQCDGRLVTCP